MKAHTEMMVSIVAIWMLFLIFPMRVLAASETATGSAQAFELKAQDNGIRTGLERSILLTWSDYPGADQYFISSKDGGELASRCNQYPTIKL